MGLLTDPGAGRGKLTMILEAHHGKLCLLLYLCGIVYFALLAHEHFSASTYFSENALLPGLVESEYDQDHSAKKFLAELQDEGARFPDSVPYSWLLAKFGQLGLETYTHNFTLEYPLGPGTQYHGKNIYAILRAPRGASTEAVVLSAPYRPPSSAHPNTHPGIALLLSLAKFFRRQKYWAKDLVFLVTEHEQLGAQAWVEAYHQASCGQPGVLLHGDLPARAGAIQAAIILELRSDRLTHIDVKVEGLNGQLPNLDLVNLVHRLCAMESVRHTFKNRENPNYADPWRLWLSSFRTMMSMVLTQASGMTNGNHGLFHRFGIEAVTLEGVERKSTGGPPMFYQMGRVVEGICRSLNNLLERFHQSFFFYLLCATDRYISIGAYMPPLGFMCGALLIKAFSLWLRMSIEETSSVANQKETSEAKEKSGCDKKKEERDEDEKEDFKENETNCETAKPEMKEENLESDFVKQPAAAQGGPVLVVVGAFVLGAHALGVVAVNLPIFATRYASASWNISTVDCVWMASVAFSILLVMFASSMGRALGSSTDVAMLLNIAALLELATLLLAVAMHNFSLALVVGTLCTPVALAVGTFKRRCLRGAVRALWLCLHPLALLSLAVLLAAKANFPEEGLLPLLVRTHQAARQALLLSAVDSLIYGSWAFNVAAGVFLPAWVLFWVAS